MYMLVLGTLPAKIENSTKRENTRGGHWNQIRPLLRQRKQDGSSLQHQEWTCSNLPDTIITGWEAQGSNPAKFGRDTKGRCWCSPASLFPPNHQVVQNFSSEDFRLDPSPYIKFYHPLAKLIRWISQSMLYSLYCCDMARTTNTHV